MLQRLARLVHAGHVPGSMHGVVQSGAGEALQGVQVDAIKLRQALSKQLCQRVVAVTELVLVHVEGLAVIVRITEVHSLDEEARQEAVSYHCYRGLVTPDTVISLVEEGESFPCTVESRLQSRAAAETPGGLGSLIIRNAHLILRAGHLHLMFPLYCSPCPTF